MHLRWPHSWMTSMPTMMTANCQVNRNAYAAKDARASSSLPALTTTRPPLTSAPPRLPLSWGPLSRPRIMTAPSGPATPPPCQPAAQATSPSPGHLPALASITQHLHQWQRAPGAGPSTRRSGNPRGAGRRLARERGLSGREPARLPSLVEAQSGDDELDHAACVVAGVVLHPAREIADAKHQFVGIHAGENLPRRGRCFEQLGAHGD